MQKISSNRSFGILFFIVFLVIAIWPLKNNEAIRLWPIPFSIIFLILGLINSNLLRPLNIIWVKFGELLGRIIAPIVMGFIYFLIITPIGLIMRIFGKDFLSIKFSKQNSYWINKIKNIGPMNRQF